MPDIKTYRSPKTIIKESTKGGKGLFATEKILRDEIVAIKSGHIVATEEAMNLDEEVVDFCLQLSDEFVLTAKSKKELNETAIFINHSCEPNIGMDGQIIFVAMREINPGEELCLDYAMVRTYDYRMKCQCNTDNCRGWITGDDWKLEELQHKYKDYFSSYIVNLMRQ